MTVIVSGTFRLLPERSDDARIAMRAVLAATRGEAGCLAYSYAEAVDEAGLFHVFEEWTDRAALERHFTTPHMKDWVEAREGLGFHDRAITVRDCGAVTPL